MRYNSPQTPPDKIRDFFLRGGIPVTLTLLTISVILFLISFFTSGQVEPLLMAYVGFVPSFFWHAPWTLLTYPLYPGQGPIGLLIGGVIFWLAGGSLERSWGSARYAAFFFALTAITALSLLLGTYLYARHAGETGDLSAVVSLRDAVFLSGFSLPLGGMIVAFCMLNPELTLTFWYLFPIRAIWIAWIVALSTYFTAGMGPILNLFACGGIIAAFLYVKFGRSWGDIGSYGAPRRAPRGPDLRVYPAARSSSQTTLDGSRKRGPFDFAGRWKDWQERRRLEKLLRNSGFSDLEPRWRDDEERRRR